jgi:Glycosyl transferases group 1
LINNHLHIVAFDIPFPADYGGVMDIFFKIKSLHQLGLKITLHAFQYREREPQEALLKYCETVHYYPRATNPLSMMSRKPYIVQSRMNNALLKNLQADDYPILFEGLHCCAFINHPSLSTRIKILRMHNVEWEYYHNLKSLENRWLQKIYYKTESHKLKRFEQTAILHADAIFTISLDDTAYFEQLIDKIAPEKNIKVNHIPPFHPNEFVESRPGRGETVLFHGKLSVPDNEQVALYLIKKIFSKKDIPLYIAGKDPSDTLYETAVMHTNVTIAANPTEQEMNKLIQNAQINIVLSFQQSGMKLKLLNALFRGRFCIVNKQIIQNTGLDSLCYVKNTSKDIASTVESLMNVQFSQKQIEDRKTLLNHNFSNSQNAQKIVEILRGYPQKNILTSLPQT